MAIGTGPNLIGLSDPFVSARNVVANYYIVGPKSATLALLWTTGVGLSFAERVAYVGKTLKPSVLANNFICKSIAISESTTRLSNRVIPPVGLFLGSITGTVKQKNSPINTPLVRPLALLNSRFEVIARTQSNFTGDYSFNGLARNVPYTVVATDTAKLYRAVIADEIYPV